MAQFDNSNNVDGDSGAIKKTETRAKGEQMHGPTDLARMAAILLGNAWIAKTMSTTGGHQFPNAPANVTAGPDSKYNLGVIPADGIYHAAATTRRGNA